MWLMGAPAWARPFFSRRRETMGSGLPKRCNSANHRTGVRNRRPPRGLDRQHTCCFKPADWRRVHQSLKVRAGRGRGFEQGNQTYRYCKAEDLNQHASLVSRVMAQALPGYKDSDVLRVRRIISGAPSETPPDPVGLTLARFFVVRSQTDTQSVTSGVAGICLGVTVTFHMSAWWVASADCRRVTRLYPSAAGMIKKQYEN